MVCFSVYVIVCATEYIQILVILECMDRTLNLKHLKHYESTHISIGRGAHRFFQPGSHKSTWRFGLVLTLHIV